MRRSLLTIGGVAAGLAGFALLLNFALPDLGAAGQVAGITQAAVAALTIAAAGIFAGFKLQLFRDFEPHLTIAHEVSHRPAGGSYTHLAVTATLRNTARVNVELRQGFYSIQQITPITDAAVEDIQAEFISYGLDDFRWPMLGQSFYRWGKGEFTVEPGETHRELVEFIIPNEIETVLIRTNFQNLPDGRISRNLRAWGCNSVYDILTKTTD